MNQIVTALCSFGMSGKVFHGPFLQQHPAFQLKSVLQRSKSDAKDHYPDIHIARTMEALLSDDSIELVIVNTPEPTHFELASKALKAGKHVVVEKAFTIDVAEADQLIALAQDHGLLLSVYQNRRWDSDFLTIQQVLKQGLLGRLVEYEAHFDRYRTYVQDSWKEVAGPGKGVLYNLGPHLIDQALVLFGMPHKVFADIRVQRTGGQIPDQFELILFYPGLKVSLKCGYLVRNEGPRYILLGEMGSFKKWGMDPQEAALKKGAIPNGPDWGVEPEENWGHLTTTVGKLELRGRIESLSGNYMAYYDNIYEALRLAKPLAVSALEGRQVIEIIEAAQASFEQGQIVSI